MGLHDTTNICLISFQHSRRDQIVFLRFPRCPDDGFVCSLMQSHDASEQIKSVPSVLGFHSSDTFMEKSRAFISFKLYREVLGNLDEDVEERPPGLLAPSVCRLQKSNSTCCPLLPYVIMHVCSLDLWLIPSCSLKPTFTTWSQKSTVEDLPFR